MNRTLLQTYRWAMTLPLCLLLTSCATKNSCLTPQTNFDADRWLVFSAPDSAEHGAPPRIFRILLDGTHLTQLTFGGSSAADRDPVWSPDGRRIVFRRSHSLDGPQDYDLMNSDGSHPKLIWQEEEDSPGPVWSPQGDRLIIGNSIVDTTGRNLGTWESPSVQLLGADTVSAFLDQASWTADGKHFIVPGVRRRYVYDNAPLLHAFLFEYDPGSRKVLRQLSQTPIDSAQAIVPSPDGSGVLAVKYSPGSGSAHDWTLLYMKLNRSGWISVAGDDFIYSPHWGRDGHSFIYLYDGPRGYPHVRIMDLNRLGQSSALDKLVVWSADLLAFPAVPACP